MKRKILRIGIATILLFAMFAMAMPVQATVELTATGTNTNSLQALTYVNYAYAWQAYYTTSTNFKGYLLNWDYASY